MLLGGLFFVYSQGFHPHPRISFAGAAAVGVESRSEFADIRVHDPKVDLNTLMSRINAGLPSGIAVTAMRELAPQDFSLAELVKGFVYDIILPEETGEDVLNRFETDISRFLGLANFPVHRKSKEKTVIKDIRPLVTDLSLDRPSRRIILSAHSGPEGTVRPVELLTALFGLSPTATHGVRIVKTTTRPADLAGPADRKIFSGT
jgi:radical SAM-linked protein